MTKKLRCGALAAISLFSVTLAMAQQAQPPALSPGPLIQNHAPNFASWTLTILHSEMDAPPASPTPGSSPSQPPDELKFIKTGQILHVMMTLKGKSINVWNVGSIKILSDAENKSCGGIVASNHFTANPFDVDLSATDFPGSQWITLATYVGLKTFMGKQCIQFRKGDDEAYVDLASRLPVGIQAAGETHLYTFLAPPTEPQSLPPAVQKFVDDRKREAARYQRASLSPF